jgi:hypothetical protein
MDVQCHDVSCHLISCLYTAIVIHSVAALRDSELF